MNGDKEGLADLTFDHDGTDRNLLMENGLAKRSSFSAQNAVSSKNEGYFISYHSNRQLNTFYKFLFK